MQRSHLPSHELGGELADDAGGRATASLSEHSRVVGEGGGGGGTVVGGAAPVTELSAMECAAAGGAAGKACVIRGADTVG